MKYLLDWDEYRQYTDVTVYVNFKEDTEAVILSHLIMGELYITLPPEEMPDFVKKDKGEAELVLLNALCYINWDSVKETGSIENNFFIERTDHTIIEVLYKDLDSIEELDGEEWELEDGEFDDDGYMPVE